MALHIKTNISIKQSFDLTETNSLSFIKFHLLAIKIKNVLEKKHKNIQKETAVVNKAVNKGTLLINTSDSA